MTCWSCKWKLYSKRQRIMWLLSKGIDSKHAYTRWIKLPDHIKAKFESE